MVSRVFVAACPSAASLQNLLPLRQWLKSKVSGIRWVREDQLHVTLAFFGDVAETTLDIFLENMESPEGGSDPFEVQIKGVGGLGGKSRLRVIHLELGQGQEVLKTWHERVSGAAQRAGLKQERRDFVPHLTFILDLHICEGLKRAAGRGGGEDRYEKMDRGYHERLRRGFLDIAKKEPDRCKVLDASQSTKAIHQAILSETLKILPGIT